MSNVMTLAVPGISCGECRQTISDALDAVLGVSSAQVNTDGQTVRVVYDGSAPPRIVAALEASGLAISGFEVGVQSLRRVS